MASGGIYNHRPSGPPPGPSVSGGIPSSVNVNRLNDSFETIRQEFDALVAELTVTRSQRDDFEQKLTAQLMELTGFRQNLHELETQQRKIQQQYEDELARMRSELTMLRQGAMAPATPHAGPPSLSGPGSSATPRPMGTPSAPFGGTDPYYRERDRERERDISDREMRDRDINNRDIAVMRERDMRERELRDVRERDRAFDQRDTKRLKADRGDRLKGDGRDVFSPSSMPKLPPHGSTTSSLAPITTIPPTAHPPYPPAQGPPPSMSAVSTTVADRSDQPASNTLATLGATSASGGFPEDLDPQSLPPELRKEGSDWFAIFNPKVKRTLDVNLVHTFMHESVVCCVRFSADGRYLATGCNRTAQIFDSRTGLRTSVLSDETAGKSGDLYIRSVCFSPDGNFLATGAEDKQIRIWDIASRTIRKVFDGHQQEIYSLDFSSDGRYIVSGSGDKTARIWSMKDGSSIVLTVNDPDSLNNDAGVTSVAISPNGQYVAAGSLDTVVRIWDTSTGALVERLKGHRDSVYSVAFTPDGKGLISGSLDKTLKYWDVSNLLNGSLMKQRKEAISNGRKEEKSNPCTMNFLGHKDYVLSVAVSHDGQWVVSGSKDRGVLFWDARTAIVQCMLQGHKNSVISIDLSPAGSILATGSGDWQARIWSYTSV